MTLYDDRSDLYDLVFPPDSEAIDFVASRLRPGARALDAGCGSGALAAALAVRGFEAEGFDLSPAMAARASARGKGRFWVGDLADSGGTEAAGPYDAILCLGNSLAHLSGPRAIRGCLKGFASLLAPDGFIVIQIVDFDLARARGLEGLPAREGPGFRFERAYDWRGDSVVFRTRLTDLSSGAAYDDETILYPLSLEELDWAARSAMLERIEGPYANFGMDPRGFDLGLVAVYGARRVLKGDPRQEERRALSRRALTRR
jgi:SAM-dependent methyltransferase